MLPLRKSWGLFPDVLIHTDETSVKQHQCYTAAKGGCAKSAFGLVDDTLSLEVVNELKHLVGHHTPWLVSAHAVEQTGVNAIPEALADALAAITGWNVESSIIQTNIVGHTGANGFARMARQALFDGDVVAGQAYVLVDDFIGQGGTLANLRGFIESKGGLVVAATVLTGKSFSAKLALDATQLASLRGKHGQELENWWQQKFGHTFDCLTQSEARYLERTQDADTIRTRITAAEQN